MGRLISWLSGSSPSADHGCADFIDAHSVFYFTDSCSPDEARAISIADGLLSEMVHV